jgi:hypothetical protein
VNKYATRIPVLIDTPALTLHNPWAHAIAHFGKDVENRSWMPPEHIDRILIHAGKAWSPTGSGYLRELGFGEIEDYDPATSAIVAVADVAYACDAARRNAPCGCGRWAAAGQCHWRLGTVWTLAEPVPCAGRQGLWRPAPEVLEAVATAKVKEA